MKLKAAVARQYDNVVVQSRLRGKTSACQFTLHGNVVRSNEWLYLGQSLSLAIKDVYILRFWDTRLCVRARACVCVCVCVCVFVCVFCSIRSARLELFKSDGIAIDML